MKPKYPSGTQKRNAKKASGLWTKADAAKEKARQTKKNKKKRGDAAVWLDGIKMQRGCTDCGYNKHPAALHFDHLPGTEKKVNLAELRLRYSVRSMKEEMEKCEVVCANCHAVRTARRREKR